MSRTNPLLSFELQQPTGARSPLPSTPSGSADGPPHKRFYHYLPLLATVLLIISPHPSLLVVLTKFHYKTLHAPGWALTHLTVTYLLTFCIFSSLIVCVARDPGPVGFEEALPKDDEDEGDMSLAQALMAPAEDEDFNSPNKWCRRCWAPKPERAHHCSVCGRCVLKMDHHCPWVGAKCIGHRTYPAFIHFLGCISLLALYIAGVGCNAVWWSFNNPFEADEVVVIHELILSALGIVFTMVIGSFFAYHLYLVLTNQTTLEHISPFLLLRQLPPLPLNNTSGRLADEDYLSYAQRRRVRSEHGRTRLYDIGWRRNWLQVFGATGKKGRWVWIWRMVCGGGSPGDGRTFPRNPHADEALSRLANDLVSLDKDA